MIQIKYLILSSLLEKNIETNNTVYGLNSFVICLTQCFFSK